MHAHLYDLHRPSVWRAAVSIGMAFTCIVHHIVHPRAVKRRKRCFSRRLQPRAASGAAIQAVGNHCLAQQFIHVTRHPSASTHDGLPRHSCGSAATRTASTPSASTARPPQQQQQQQLACSALPTCPPQGPAAAAPRPPQARAGSSAASRPAGTAGTAASVGTPQQAGQHLWMQPQQCCHLQAQQAPHQVWAQQAKQQGQHLWIQPHQCCFDTCGCRYKHSGSNMGEHCLLQLLDAHRHSLAGGAEY